MKLIVSALFIIFLEFIVSNVNAALMRGTMSKIAKYIDYTPEQVDLFVTFKTIYKKKYRDNNEEAIAVKNFINNVATIDSQNEKFRRGETKFKTAIWINSDMNRLDFLESFTGYVGKPMKRLYKTKYRRDKNLPKYLNYFEDGFVTKVSNQRYCGSSWAFATIGALEAQFARKTGVLRKLSEQNLIDCDRSFDYSGNRGCKGGNMRIAYEYLIKTGINAENIYPYRGKGKYNCNFNSSLSLGKVYDFVEIERKNETALMYALYHAGGPIAVAIDASDPAFQNYQSGIYDFPECVNEPNHAALLIGYGFDYSFTPPAAYWLLKNSWGVEWGEKGFFRISKDANNLCNIATDASYPIVA
ncbi:hypothetical protein PVAND_013135 [Polypedilum vanderplanki]|uniref:Peptidase C1A papain C-terminal domain-containing protein n=1 Tax=Polypedilum vanderplanki TaxID=319348 RepID=A0A9J6CNJ9_POLVA|nr:hypothetical protein PVAND_013135 [Polypedilum vanderplanki]